MPRLRQNIVTSEWVVIAPGRAKRPEDFVIEKPHRAERKGPCPFCKGGDGYVNAYPKDRTENVYATPNKYPAFVEKPSEAPPIFKEDPGIYTTLPALGGHEVIVIADHIRDVSHLTSEEIFDLINFGMLQNYGNVYIYDFYMGIIFNYNTQLKVSITNNSLTNRDIYFSLFGLDYL